MAKQQLQKSLAVGESICEHWNLHWPVGTQVTLVDDLGNPILTQTTSEAWCLGHGEPVVKVAAKRGGYMLSRLIPTRPRSPEELLQATSRDDIKGMLAGYSPEYLASCGIV
jgi:hypothetical protein